VSEQRPIAKLSRRYHFSASHRLHTEEMDEARNREVYGKCNNPYGHGHNYIVGLTFSGPVDADTGMVTNLADLDSFAKERLTGPLHLQNLNTLEWFRDKVSTTENLAMEVHRIFAAYPHARLERVQIDETPNNSFEYSGEEGRLRS
jgi:6-pyruvoyltetrahydropterin/6-carboxytetrahydropterin synthase